MRQIFLDYNATTPIAPSIAEAMQPFLLEHYGDPASQHALGRACAESLADARGQVASLVGCLPHEIIFTSGGSEANNLAIKGVVLKASPRSGGHLIISAIEHASVTGAAKFLERLGYSVTVVGCDRLGRVDPAAIEEAIRDNTRLVSVMHANHETGVLQPIRRIAQTCRRKNILLHTDAAQTAGKIPTKVNELGVDLLSISGHKFYAPKGIGALYVRDGVALEPLVHGEGQEAGLRGGVENVAGAIGLGKAASLVSKCLDDAAAQMQMLRDQLWNALRGGIGEKLSMNGPASERLPTTLSVNFPGVSSHELLARIPELCAATGGNLHEAAGSISPTLKAMGLTDAVARGTLRLSVGWQTSLEEIERAANLLIKAWEDLQPLPARGKGFSRE